MLPDHKANSCLYQSPPLSIPPHYSLAELHPLFGEPVYTQEFRESVPSDRERQSVMVDVEVLGYLFEL